MALLTNQQKLLLHRNLARAMAVDRQMMRIIRRGAMVGFYHEGGISLAPGVAAGSFLSKEDCMWPHYRGHGVAHLLSKGVDIKHYLAEHMGREAGCCKGRSSYHYSFPEDHVHCQSGNIGANFGVSVGWGVAARYKRSGQIVMTCSGDGSYCQGRAHEAFLMAASWKLPMIFWCEANGMLQHTAMKDVCAAPGVAEMMSGHGLPTLVVDGQDLLACGEAALDAIAHVRAGHGPFFVECKVLRAQEHNVGGVNNEGANPRDPKLMKEWQDNRDPLKRVREQLLAAGLITAEAIERLEAEADREAQALDAFSEQSPKALPTVESMLAAVYAA